STINTFGAPDGGRNRSIGGNTASGSVAAYVVNPARGRSGIGSTSRGRPSRTAIPASSTDRRDWSVQATVTTADAPDHRSGSRSANPSAADLPTALPVVKRPLRRSHPPTRVPLLPTPEAIGA